MSDSDYKYILDHYTPEKQIVKAVEELSELAAILSKYFVSDKSTRFSFKSLVIEEIADVEIMIKQLKIIFNLNDTAGAGILTSIKREKLARTMKRIKEDKMKIFNRFTGKEILDTKESDLSRANLFGADLSRANLFGACLSRADLSGADLSRADLSGANLYGANLSGANLYGANLYGADLSGANLYGANLSRADLSRANLFGANLSGADLSRANLFGAENFEDELLISFTSILPEGDLIGYKKCKGDIIVKLKIPAKARRSNATGRKCRAECVKVLKIYGEDKAISQHDNKTEYKVGETVKCDKWDDNRWEECSGGIHFFITKAEAERY